MQVYLLIVNVDVSDVPNIASSELVGIYDTLEQAKQTRKSYARRLAREAVPDGDCSDEYENAIECLDVYEVVLNQTYFNKKLAFNML